MTGYFIYNKQFVSNKFLILFDCFKTESKKLNIDLEFLDNFETFKKISVCSLEVKDFVIFWDKDIKLAKMLEDLGHKVFNNSKAIEICDDKAKTYISLLDNKIKQPKTIVFPLIYNGSIASYNDFIEFSINNISFPIVIKECFGSFGQQVYLSKNKEELVKIIDSLGTKPFILQELIKTSIGKDLRLEVIGDEIVATVIRENKNDFRANLTNGGIASKYNPSLKQMEMALNVSKYLNLDFAGVDILFGENAEPVLCEVNSNAYPINVQNITGVNIVNKILNYIIRKIK